MKKAISIVMLLAAVGLSVVSMLLWSWQLELIAALVFVFGVYTLCKADSEEESDGA